MSKKFNSVSNNKSPCGIQTQDVRSTSPTPLLTRLWRKLHITVNKIILIIKHFVLICYSTLIDEKQIIKVIKEA